MKFIKLLAIPFFAALGIANPTPMMVSPALMPRGNYCQFQCSSSENYVTERIKQVEMTEWSADYRAGCENADKIRTSFMSSLISPY